ncbi:hypothetical protein BJ085DRAFT_31088 [Dimargaris cristalligena]|uniref:Uncharacterized protein n=1 Tax=Dimargaris cristalligena TaxID=215637 RepID=A0A4P9ZUX1_9FUNG|nr:hypothetical protein BJ085DRAFT_31088 [Dimargaris cristalligena]|eukprot:RKP37374.1 hypothetical protein BJ085DRAFT_31088 [Dimargaris cristalligena]
MNPPNYSGAHYPPYSPPASSQPANGWSGGGGGGGQPYPPSGSDAHQQYYPPPPATSVSANPAYPYNNTAYLQAQGPPPPPSVAFPGTAYPPPSHPYSQVQAQSLGTMALPVPIALTPEQIHGRLWELCKFYLACARDICSFQDQIEPQMIPNRAEHYILAAISTAQALLDTPVGPSTPMTPLAPYMELKVRCLLSDLLLKYTKNYDEAETHIQKASLLAPQSNV